MFQLLHNLTSDCNVSLYCFSFLPIILVLTSKDELLKPHLRTHAFQVPQVINHWKDPLSLDCRRIFSRTHRFGHSKPTSGTLWLWAGWLSFSAFIPVVKEHMVVIQCFVKGMQVNYISDMFRGEQAHSKCSLSAHTSHSLQPALPLFLSSVPPSFSILFIFCFHLLFLSFSFSFLFSTSKVFSLWTPAP